MSSRGEAADAATTVVRPDPWSPQGRWVLLGTEALRAALLSAPFLLQVVVHLDDRPSVARLMILGVGAAFGLIAWEWWSVSRERLVLTDESVELWRGRRARPRARLVRSQVWAARLEGKPFANDQLVLSDGDSGMILAHAAWSRENRNILSLLDIAAPVVTRRVARDRHPEAFPWSLRHPVLGTLVGVAVLVTVFVLFAILGR